MFPENKIEFFLSKIDKNGSNGCWKWNGTKDKDGYGQLKVNKKQYRAHRASWMIHYGEIPESMLVCHKCDNRECTNPNHLFIGSPSDNSEDMVFKNRSAKPKGELNNNSILTSIQVSQIMDLLSNGMTAVDVAKKFNVCNSTIQNINHGSWSHVKMSDDTDFKTATPRKTRWLTEKEVRSIKLTLATTSRLFPDIAKDFGVHRMTIERIANGDTWRDLEIILPNGNKYAFENKSYTRTKISKDDVVEIKKLVLKGELSYGNIAKLYPISKSNVYQIARGSSWKDVYIIREDGSKWFNIQTNNIVFEPIGKE